MLRLVLPRKCIIFFLFWLSSYPLFAYKAPVISMDDSAINSDLSSISLVVKVDAVNLTELKGGLQDEATALQQILITLPGANDKPIQYGTTPVDGRSDEHYFDGTVKFDDSGTPNQSNLTYTLTIRDNPDSQAGSTHAIKTLYAGTPKKVTVKVRFAYYEGGVLRSSDSSDQKDLILQLAFPTEAPPDVKAVNEFQGVMLSWTFAGQVKHVDAKYTKTPSKVLAIILNENAVHSKADSKYKGFLPTTDPNVEPEAIDCVYDDTDETSCLVCKKGDGTLGYFDESQVANPAEGLERIASIPNTPKSGATTVSTLIDNLESPDHDRKKYWVILQYPKGLARTQCFEVNPTDNKSFLELHGAERQKGDPRCFIVSAAYGSPFEKHVDIFRWFRDKFLLTTNLGSQFVDFYYNHSQPLAETIKENGFLQTSTKALLWTPALFLYFLKYGIENPLGFTLFSSLILGCFVLGFRFLKTNRRRRIQFLK